MFCYRVADSSRVETFDNCQLLLTFIQISVYANNRQFSLVSQWEGFDKCKGAGCPTPVQFTRRLRFFESGFRARALTW